MRAASSSQRLRRKGGVQEREVRVDLQGARQRGAAGRVATEAELDHPSVEDLQGVQRSEAERATGMDQCLAATAALVEGPGEDVVSVDRFPVAICRSRTLESVRDVAAVVQVE